MAFSLTHRKVQQLPLGQLTREQFLVLAIEAAQQADWSIGHTTAKGFSAFTGFSLSSFSEEFSIDIQEDTVLIKSECLGTQLYDWGKNKRNLQAFQGKFQEMQAYFSEVELQARYDYLQQEHAFAEFATEETTKLKITGFFALFMPQGGYFITSILLNLNLLVFILMTLSGANLFAPDAYYLLKWGANFQPQTLDGQPWCLLTACFLHVGIFHLLLNMYALTYIGSLLEPLIGRYRFLMAYLATGILASVASMPVASGYIFSGSFRGNFWFVRHFSGIINHQLYRTIGSESFFYEHRYFCGAELTQRPEFRRRR